jgi:hypothetical protein
MIFKQSELVEIINEKNIENFEKNGGINMYIYKTSKDEEEKSKKSAVLEKIKEIDSKYQIQEYTPAELETLGLEEMDFIAPTKEDVESQAINSLKDYKDNNLKSIDEKYETKFSSLSENALKVLEDKQEDEEKIDLNYEKSLQKTKNSNIKKGLAHSSIFENALKAIEEDKEVSKNIVEQEYLKKISKLENEKSILEQQKESALTSFDISYATKLQSKIANINSEIAKEKDKVLKYNQEIAKQEAAFQKEQEKSLASEQKKVDERNKALQDLINKKGQTEVSRMKAQEKYEIIYDYLSNLPKEEALKELENDKEYKNHLGSFYSLLYAQMMKRKD